jgi:cytidylate kinase
VRAARGPCRSSSAQSRSCRCALLSSSRANLRPTPPLVTISASYGAGGSQVGPALAQRLGVEFLDRAIPTRVADRLHVPLDDALAHDESLGDAIGRLASSFALLPELAGAMVQAGVLAGEDYRRETENLIREHAATGAVILGRAGAVILREHDDALHVRLDGPSERRVEQAMEFEGLSRADAERLRRDGDRARLAYVRHFYGCDARDPAHYHLVIDSTRLEPETVVDVIVAAAVRR